VFFFYGAGLGMSMTATSLLFSDRYRRSRARMLEGLNFVWSAGAMAAPVLFLAFTRGANPNSHLGSLFFTLEGLFLLLLAWAVFQEKNELGLARDAETQEAVSGAILGARSAAAGAVLVLVLLAMGAVGVETSLSSWLTIYVHRLARPGSEVFFPVTFFYAGVVLSRLMASTNLLEKVGRVRALEGLLWAVALAVALLVALRQPALIDAAAAIAGLAIGPLYPLLLAFLMERAARGWVYAVAGVGASLFPLLTGISSARFGSLRYGLIVPLAAALAMAGAQLAFFRPREGVFAGSANSASSQKTIV